MKIRMIVLYAPVLNQCQGQYSEQREIMNERVYIEIDGPYIFYHLRKEILRFPYSPPPPPPQGNLANASHSSKETLNRPRGWVALYQIQLKVYYITLTNCFRSPIISPIFGEKHFFLNGVASHLKLKPSTKGCVVPNSVKSFVYSSYKLF